jgi:pyruvate dehydrogenase E1 component alpha subunit
MYTLSPDPGAALLRTMLRIRTVEETIAERYRDGKMRCPTHLCTGQEAVSAAVGLALRPDDFAVSTHRAHGHYLGKGGDLKRMMAEIHGKSTGCSAGKGVGLGLSIQLHGTDQVSCVFLGDAVVEEGVFFESVNVAVVRGLPVLFVCENNLYSVYSPMNVRQPEARAIDRMVAGLGIETHAGDGNDALGAYALAGTAIATIRRERRPVFLEFATYRWREHCGPNFDNHIGYRSEEEYLDWKARDPITHLVDSMQERGELTNENVAEITEQIRAEVDEAFAFAEASPFPAPEDLFDHLYSQA